MSDEIREDTLDEAATGDTLEQTQADNGVDEKPQLIFGKYKDMDAAQKAMAEAEQRMHAATAEAAALKEKAQLTDAITKLSETTAKANEAPDNSEELYRAKMAEIAEDYRENPDIAIEKQFALTNAWIADEGKKVTEATSKEITELRTQLGQMQALMGDRDPAYLENKETVDKMVALGMPKENAIAWAKENAPEESRVLPANMNGAGVRGEESKGAYLTKDDRARYKAQGYSDEDLDDMEADHQRRAKAGR